VKFIALFFSILFSNVFLGDCPDILNHEVRVLDSEETENLCEYKNKVVLAVNVASRCGYTYQYEALQDLYKDLRNLDFVVLGFPSRDFMFQEYKDESKVKEFCSTEYGVTFPMFATSPVKGKKANNFYKALIQQTGVEPGWNFHKYLIDKEGKVKSFNTKIEPDSLELIQSIKSILK
tara:strand:- start:357 stop:887 length:531 start_codon:yes stop_codon:yes gene_type:complete